MPTFQKVKLGDLFTLEYGKGLIAGNRVSGDFSVYGSSGQVGTHTEYLVEGPGIIVGRKGSVGEIYFSKNNFYPIDTVYFILKNDKKYNIRFLYYFLKLQNLKRLQGDTGVPGLNRNTVHSEIVNFPLDTKVQERIAGVLSAYDDLIENNEKRIKALEQMAQLLYTEWFVKFNFHGYEKIKLINSHTEYGPIPEGWEVVNIGDILEVIKRKMKLQTNEYQITGLYPIIDQGKDFIAGYTNDKETVYDEDLIVFGDHTRCLKYCNFPFACGADGTQLLKTNNPERIPQILLYYSVMNAGLQNYSYARHFKFLKALNILKPDLATANAFDKLVSQSYEQIKKLRQQNDNLSQTRDLLIPQLVTGKRELKQ